MSVLDGNFWLINNFYELMNWWKLYKRHPNCNFINLKCWNLWESDIDFESNEHFVWRIYQEMPYGEWYYLGFILCEYFNWNFQISWFSSMAQYFKSRWIWQIINMKVICHKYFVLFYFEIYFMYCTVLHYIVIYCTILHL